MRGRRAFDAFRSTPRYFGSAGSIKITFVERTDSPGPAIAFAIGRSVGSAVVRNRLRRQLRVIMRELAPEMKAGDYLVGVSPQAVTKTFQELQANVCHALLAVGRSRQR